MSHHQCSAGQSFAAIICTELKYNTSPNSDSPSVEYLQQPTTLFHNIIPYTQIIPVSADHDRLPPHLPRTSRHGSRRYRIRPVIGATMVD